MVRFPHNRREANHLLRVPADYQHLAVPVPPMLEVAIGFDAGASEDFQPDFISFHYAGTKPYWDTGAGGATGWWPAYALFIRHPKVQPYLVDRSQPELEPETEVEAEAAEKPPGSVSFRMLRYYNLGSDDEWHTHRLLLDLRTRLIYVLPDQEARILLRLQWTADGQEPPPLTPEQKKAIRATQEEMMQQYNDPGSELYKQLHREVTTADIYAKMVQDDRLYQEMKEWLDTHDYQPPTPSAGI